MLLKPDDLFKLDDLLAGLFQRGLRNWEGKGQGGWVRGVSETRLPKEIARWQKVAWRSFSTSQKIRRNHTFTSIWLKQVKTR